MRVELLEPGVARELEVTNRASFIFDPCTPPRGWVCAPLFYKTIGELHGRCGRFGEGGFIRPLRSPIRFFRGAIPGQVWERIWAAIPEFGRRNLFVAAPSTKFFTLSPPLVDPMILATRGVQVMDGSQRVHYREWVRIAIWDLAQDLRHAKRQAAHPGGSALDALMP